MAYSLNSVSIFSSSGRRGLVRDIYNILGCPTLTALGPHPGNNDSQAEHYHCTVHPPLKGTTMVHHPLVLLFASAGTPRSGQCAPLDAVVTNYGQYSLSARYQRLSRIWGSVRLRSES